MRFLFLTNFYPPADLGGWEQWCQEIAVEFRKRGHEVTVLTSRFQRDNIVETEPDIIRDLFLESDLENYQPVDFFFKLPGRDRYNKSRLRAVISTTNPDIVFIWGMWQLNPELAAIAEDLCPKRTVYYFCGFWPIPAEEADPHVSYWQRHQFPVGRLALQVLAARRKQRARFKYVACVSQFVLNRYKEHGFQFDESRVIYGGIDTQAFARPAGQSEQKTASAPPLKLLFAGTVSPQKGADTAVAAISLLAKKYPPSDLQLSIVGTGHPNFMRSLHKMVESGGLEETVNFRGRIPKEQMPNLFHEHDVLLFTSTWEEPLARMMMEGLAAGAVVISTPTGGSSEAIEHGENGLLFRSGNAADLARKVEMILADPDLAKRLATRGRQTAVSRFDFQRMADELEQFCLARAKR